MDSPGSPNRSWIRPIIWVLAFGTFSWFLLPDFGNLQYTGPLRAALATALRQQAQLELDSETSPHWLGTAHSEGQWPWGSDHAIVLARKSAGKARDLYWVRVAISSDGHLLRLHSIHNLTQTSIADESGLVGHGSHIAWQVGDGRRVRRVEYANVQGLSRCATNAKTQSGCEPRHAHWGRVGRLQRRLTRLQETGQGKAIARRSFKLEPATPELSLSFTHSQRSALELVLKAEDRLTRVPTDGGPLAEGAHYVVEMPRIEAEPASLLPWAVERIRRFNWFGSDRMQWVKAVAYRTLDWLEMSHGDQDEIAWKLAEDLGEVRHSAASSAAETVSSVEARWPPPAVSTIVEPTLEGEGHWRSLENDRFVRHSPANPPPFATTFVRTDRERLDSRVLIVLWDPRRVQLDFATGTREPRSATGEIGTGLIPRHHSRLPRLIGAFNGAFRTRHGNWGAQAHSQLYVPPKPYAATVALFADGATGFGTWPLDTSVPSGIVSFRQNLTPLISQSQFNLYQRTWWGGVPDGWTDDTRTVRSGLCETTDKFVAYFYGMRVDHEHLAKAMALAKCRYGIHLDMNQGHTGFEFYSVNSSLPLLAPDSLDESWQAQGTLRDAPQYQFRARKLFRDLPLMNFPRYIHRQNRDFFYLTERPTLPAARLRGAFPQAEREGVWKLPAARASASPIALATTWLRPDVTRPQTKVRVVQLELKWLSALNAPAPNLVGNAHRQIAPAVLTLRQPRPLTAASSDLEDRTPRSLWLVDHKAYISEVAPEGGILIAREEKLPDPGQAAWGLLSPSRLVYVEVVTQPSPDLDPQLLKTLLIQIGCTDTISSSSAAPALQDRLDLAGHPVPLVRDPSFKHVHLIRDEWPASRPLFADTAVVGPGVWYDLQH